MFPTTVSTQLKDLVKSVRQCKSASDERNLVAKECAKIRNNFKNENADTRCVAVTKLLYFYILGYPAHFGQMECLKLIASDRFVDKRIGYLGCRMLLDELADVHVLVTNCLKNDLIHQNQHVKGLALCTLASICSPDMAQMLAFDVEEIIKKSSKYLRKKATLCATRIISKCPELISVYFPYVKSLIIDTNVGVQLCGCTLAITMCELNPTIVKELRTIDIIPSLSNTLKSLTTFGSAPEHSVHGVGNPFLQVKILRLFSFLGKDDPEISISISHILAQTITNTKTKKNAGNAILYEAILTIFNIQSTKDLKVLAINLLGKFLEFADKNIKYIAINTMLKVSNYDVEPLLRHRDIVLKCIHDQDLTIQKRAIELIFKLITNDNIASTIDCVLQCLSSCDSSMKQLITSNIITSLEGFDLDRLWQIDTFITLLETASTHVRDDAISNFVYIVSNYPEVREHVAFRLFRLLQQGNTKPVLTNISCWCIGEYGNSLFSPKSGITDVDVLDCFSSVFLSSQSSDTTKCIAILALSKLSSKHPPIRDVAVSLISRFRTSIDIESQQRSTEFLAVVSQYASLIDGIYDSMPALPVKFTSFNPEPQFASVASNVNTQVDTEKSLLSILEESLTFIPTDVAKGGQTLEDLFTVPNTEIQIYNKNGVFCHLSYSSPCPDNSLTVTFHALNTNIFDISNFSIRISLPKNISFSFKSPSFTSIPSSRKLTQDFVVNNSKKDPLKVRFKLNFSCEGKQIEELIEVNDFPNIIWH